MQFKSEFVIPFSQHPVRKGDQFFLAGSCFAEHLFKGLKTGDSMPEGYPTAFYLIP